MNGEYTNQFQELHYLCALEESEKHDLVLFYQRFKIGHLGQYEFLSEHSRREYSEAPHVEDKLEHNLSLEP